MFAILLETLSSHAQLKPKQITTQPLKPYDPRVFDPVTQDEAIGQALLDDLAIQLLKSNSFQQDLALQEKIITAITLKIKDDPILRSTYAAHSIPSQNQFVVTEAMILNRVNQCINDVLKNISIDHINKIGGSGVAEDCDLILKETVRLIGEKNQRQKIFNNYGIVDVDKIQVGYEFVPDQQFYKVLTLDQGDDSDELTATFKKLHKLALDNKLSCEKSNVIQPYQQLFIADQTTLESQEISIPGQTGHIVLVKIDETNWKTIEMPSGRTTRYRLTQVSGLTPIPVLKMNLPSYQVRDLSSQSNRYTQFYKEFTQRLFPDSFKDQKLNTKSLMGEFIQFAQVKARIQGTEFQYRQTGTSRDGDTQFGIGIQASNQTQRATIMLNNPSNGISTAFHFTRTEGADFVYSSSNFGAFVHSDYENLNKTNASIGGEIPLISSKKIKIGYGAGYKGDGTKPNGELTDLDKTGGIFVNFNHANGNKPFKTGVGLSNIGDGTIPELGLAFAWLSPNEHGTNQHSISAWSEDQKHFTKQAASYQLGVTQENSISGAGGSVAVIKPKNNQQTHIETSMAISRVQNLPNGGQLGGQVSGTFTGQNKDIQLQPSQLEIQSFYLFTGGKDHKTIYKVSAGLLLKKIRPGTYQGIPNTALRIQSKNNNYLGFVVSNPWRIGSISDVVPVVGMSAGINLKQSQTKAK